MEKGELQKVSFHPPTGLCHGCQSVYDQQSKMSGYLLTNLFLLLQLPLGLALGRGSGRPLGRGSGRTQRGASLLGRNVREARITLELAMGMERELRKAVRSLEQRLQGMEESIDQGSDV